MQGLAGAPPQHPKRVLQLRLSTTAFAFKRFAMDTPHRNGTSETALENIQQNTEDLPQLL
jgi:hypothetical protein